MGTQAIEAASQQRRPAIQLTTAQWALRRGLSFRREDASTVLAQTDQLPRSTIVEGSRVKSRAAGRACAAAGACILCLLIGAMENGLCGEGKARAQAITAPTKVAQASQFAPDREQRQTLEPEEERGGAEALAGALTSKLRAELDAARSDAEAVEIRQRQALNQERHRADTLAHELATLRAELDTAKAIRQQPVQAIDAGIRQTQGLEQAGVDQEQALEQERGRADNLARELASVRAEFDKARTAGSPGAEAAQAAVAAVEQKQAAERELEQQRDKAEAVARELTSLRAELDAARAATPAAVQIAEAATIEQKRAFEKERGRTETLTRELASVRKQAEERSMRLAAAHAEVLQVMETNRAVAAEQKQALASEHKRADALARELASMRDQLETANRQLAALSTSRALPSREPAVDSPRERVAESSSSTTERKSRLRQQISGQTAVSISERSSASEPPPPEAQSAARDPTSELRPKVTMMAERSTSASAASRSLVDETRLLARASALLRQADISGARTLLEHALEHGSARAAFMLAETYDARVLQSWGARGIPGDPAKARELYERAQAGGIDDAKERIKTLK
jgi:hypothetical protein